MGRLLDKGYYYENRDTLTPISDSCLSDSSTDASLIDSLLLIFLQVQRFGLIEPLAESIDYAGIIDPDFFEEWSSTMSIRGLKGLLLLDIFFSAYLLVESYFFIITFLGSLRHSSRLSCRICFWVLLCCGRLGQLRRLNGSCSPACQLSPFDYYTLTWVYSI